MFRGGFEGDPFDRPMSQEELDRVARQVASGSTLPTPGFWQQLGFEGEPQPSIEEVAAETQGGGS